MSTFAVFGMTRHIALQMARKKTSNIVGNTIIPESEWDNRVSAAADAIMSGSKIKQISDAFDAPQFAQEWIDLCRRSGHSRYLHIRAKRVVRDEKGSPMYSKNGRSPKKSWVPFEK